jgi:hypothetical protein
VLDEIKITIKQNQTKLKMNKLAKGVFDTIASIILVLIPAIILIVLSWYYDMDKRYNPCIKAAFKEMSPGCCTEHLISECSEKDVIRVATIFSHAIVPPLLMYCKRMFPRDYYYHCLFFYGMVVYHYSVVEEAFSFSWL